MNNTNASLSSSSNPEQKRKNSYATLAKYIDRDDISMENICFAFIDKGYIKSRVNDDPDDHWAITSKEFASLQEDIAQYNTSASCHEILVVHKVRLTYDDTDVLKRRPDAEIYFELKCNRQDAVPIEEVLKVLRILVKYSSTLFGTEQTIETFVDGFIRDIDGMNLAVNTANSTQSNSKQIKSSK